MANINPKTIEALIKGNLEVQLEFLAAKILITRLKMAVTKNPDELDNAVQEFIKLLSTNEHLPVVSKDIAKFI